MRYCVKKYERGNNIMTKVIEDCFEMLLKHYSTNNNSREILIRLKDFIENYDDEYRKEIIHIAQEATSDELSEIYNKYLKDGTLSKDEFITYALISNDNLPENIANQICFDDLPYQRYQYKLLEKHKDVLTEKTFAEIYKYNDNAILQNVVKSHYKNNITIEDVNYPEWMIQHIARQVIDTPYYEYYTYGSYLQRKLEVFRYIQDEKFIDECLKHILCSNNDNNNYDRIISEMINNYFISEEKKDEIFNEFCVDIENIKKATPYIVEEIYRSSISTIFKSDDYASKTNEEKKGYYIAKKCLSNCISHHLLTSGMEYDLMQMLVDRNNRSSDNLTSELVARTKDPRVLHLALGLKSTTDKDRAIDNKYLSKEDIIEVSKISQKAVERDLKKHRYASDKHTRRLNDLSQRATLPDDVYETMLKLNDYTIQKNLPLSIYTPRHVLEKLLNSILQEKKIEMQEHRPVKTIQEKELIIRLMLFCIDNKLPREKGLNLINAITNNHKTTSKIYYYSNNYEIESALRLKKQSIKDFLLENSEVNTYKKFFLDILSKFEFENDYKEAVLQILDLIESPDKIDKNKEEQKPMSLKEVQSEINSFTFFKYKYFTLERQLNIYINLEDDAIELLKLNEQKEKLEKEIEKEDVNR
jgi:hypothetical protein